jgi:hypothetical protein
MVPGGDVNPLDSGFCPLRSFSFPGDIGCGSFFSAVLSGERTWEIPNRDRTLLSDTRREKGMRKGRGVREPGLGGLEEASVWQ